MNLKSKLNYYFYKRSQPFSNDQTMYYNNWHYDFYNTTYTTYSNSVGPIQNNFIANSNLLFNSGNTITSQNSGLLNLPNYTYTIQEKYCISLQYKNKFFYFESFECPIVDVFKFLKNIEKYNYLAYETFIKILSLEDRLELFRSLFRMRLSKNDNEFRICNWCNLSV